ncbi:MAG: repressor LexA [Nitrospirae bacterium GWC2_57_9]|nr:MAG: repressor LexA [Nitrospirae bacterium GWC2_57_9]
MRKTITDRQQGIYDFIRAVVDKRGMPPTMREIGEKFGIRSTNGVEGHLAALESRGLITRERGKSRGILIRSGVRTPVAVPLLGRVAAGLPVLSPENREGEVMVDPSLFSLRSLSNIFALKVKGESMVDAHILEGDILLVRAQATAQDGDIVIALVDGEATVKRFFAEKNRVRLQPENPVMKPLFVDRGELLILGKAVGVARRL